MMKTQALPELIAQGQEILSAIRQHPQFKALDFQPDVNVADAQQALTELGWELQAHSNLDLNRFEDMGYWDKLSQPDSNIDYDVIPY
ncbi:MULTISPECIES: hypothetical protein [Nostoc]|uniref:Nif11-like leader peptide family natural product n=1 Tax=Nostoc paludosum FACHB-159 TaxID=2692908 RepID=A0ABR8KEM1_9NOSO|nr:MULTISPECIES: hypothetical protein [Nostoc]MBD2681560.1 hypothetical protein [Nostoc sp. FACHB-857]MBD2738021.1 hypothetical protein [Nostoc paludosum FACHB-159]